MAMLVDVARRVVPVAQIRLPARALPVGAGLTNMVVSQSYAGDGLPKLIEHGDSVRLDLRRRGPMESRPRTSRPRWSDTFKKRVVSEASQPGVTVAQVAHRYDLDAKRISNWKTKFGSGSALVPVEVTTDDDHFPMSADRSTSCIEIDLPCGTRSICETHHPV